MKRTSRAPHMIFSMQMSSFYPHLDAVNYRIDLQRHWQKTKPKTRNNVVFLSWWWRCCWRLWRVRSDAVWWWLRHCAHLWPAPSPWPTPTRPSTPSTAATSDSSLDPDTQCPERVATKRGRNRVLGFLQLLDWTGLGMVELSMDRRDPVLNTDLGMADKESEHEQQPGSEYGSRCVWLMYGLWTEAQSYKPRVLGFALRSNGGLMGLW
jgi:hypothetical protein